MPSLLRSSILALSLALSAPLAPSQLLVQPGGDLQAAIDAAPDGGWVLINGGRYRAPLVVVDKSIALVGLQPWEVRTDGGYGNPSVLFSTPGASWTQQAWCIEARGTGTEYLIVHNARLGGSTFGAVNYGGGPIRVEDYRGLWVVDTLAEGFDSTDLDQREAVPGLMFQNRRTAFPWILVERSAVIGGIPSAGDPSFAPSAPEGAPGIYAPGTLLDLQLTYVRGGRGAGVVWWAFDPSWRPSSQPCPCTQGGGIGGPGVEAGGIYSHSIAIVEGGRGGSVFVFDGTRSIPWGYQARGERFRQLP